MSRSLFAATSLILVLASCKGGKDSVDGKVPSTGVSSGTPATGTGTGAATGTGTGTGAATGTGTGTGAGTGSGTGTGTGSVTYPTGVEGCGNGVDDNADGLVDCGDPMCIGDARCPTAGDIVVTELLVNPAFLADDAGEWLELSNPTGTDFDLIGCETVDDQGGVEVQFTASFVVPAGGTATVARGPAPGFTADHTDGGMSLGNGPGADGFTVECAGVVLDAVSWNPADYDIGAGASIQLDPAAFGATLNDDPTNWCRTNAASPGYTGGDFGNPGVQNPACPVAGPEVCDDGADNDLDGVLDCGDDDCAGDAACPAAGDIAVTEIHADAGALPDDEGDWFELYNPTATDWNLAGCISEDDNGFGTEAIFPSVVVPAGGVITVAAGPAPGFTPDVVATNLSLAANQPDGFSILCGGVTLDTVGWDPAGWPVTTGQSMQVDPGAMDATSNDYVANWCQTNAADPGYTSGDHGNPGVVNPACPVAAPESCADAVDNDLDGDTDCADSDCTADPICQEACTGGVDEDLDGDIDCGDTDCTGDAACPAAGDLVITELMIDAGAISDAQGQYFELHNPTGTSFDLVGCGIWDDFNGLDDAIDSSLVVPAGGSVAISRGTDPGFTPAFVAPNMIFGQGYGGDGVVLDCAGVTIDRVDWDQSWPWFSGFAMQLDPGSTDATSNDDPNNWCTTNAADPGFTSGDMGNPGVANPACPTSAPEVCGDGIDNDLDLDTDCRDSDCIGDAACAENCINGLDDNFNGDIDCADVECAGDSACPTAGSVIVTEVMFDPAALAQDEGDWFELYNTTVDPITLQGCTSEDDGGAFTEVVFDQLVVVPPGDTITVSRGPSPGFTPDFVDGSMNLFEGGIDGFTLTCFGVDIDTVGWGGATWPSPTGASIQLDSGFFDATDNDDPANWCPASAADPGFTSGDLGSPGVVNGACPTPVPEVCDDGVDNDLDGDLDCLDSDCAADAACALPLVECDSRFCTMAAGAGAHGGDLCSCTIPGASHPTADRVEASCWGGFGNDPSVELFMGIDLQAGGYTEYAVDTCTATAADASVAVFDGDPTAGANEEACNEDGTFQFSGCAFVADAFGGPDPVAAPASGNIVVVIDEYAVGDYWDGTTTRTFEVELIP